MHRLGKSHPFSPKNTDATLELSLNLTKLEAEQGLTFSSVKLSLFKIAPTFVSYHPMILLLPRVHDSAYIGLLHIQSFR